MTDREKLVKCLKAVDQDTSNIVCEEGEEWGIIADYLIAKGVTLQKRGKWVVNRESEEGYKHHMCNKCKTEAPFHYTYIDDYDEGLDGEWFYLGQRESGIVEHMGNYCPNCGAKLEGRV